VAEAIIAVSRNNQTSLGALTIAGLDVVDIFLFPPQRPWLKALGIQAAARPGEPEYLKKLTFIIAAAEHGDTRGQAPPG
jgi:hypothetical protein